MTEAAQRLAEDAVHLACRRLGDAARAARAAAPPRREARSGRACLRGSVLTDPPSAVPGIEVRPIETLEEYAVVHELGWDLVGIPENDRVGLRKKLRIGWDEYQTIDIVNYAAFLDGRLVAAGGIHALRCIPRRREHPSRLSRPRLLSRARAGTLGGSSSTWQPAGRHPVGQDVEADPRASKRCSYASSAKQAWVR
jgi:hypothetical protein